MKTKEYSSQNLTVLEGLEAVRARPGMYIGSTGSRGLHHILWEIVDNAIDEAANGYADRIEVTLHEDGSASVEDNGRGIPVDIHEKTKLSGVELVFTKLHAGGKFDDGNYNYSGGLHGVGASVTNALSEWLIVEVYKKTVYTMSFKSYFDEKEKKYKSGVPAKQLENTNQKTTKKGTYVRFMPDGKVFDTLEFSFDTISKRLKELAFLNKGLEINVVDKRHETDKGIVAKNYKYDGGIRDYVSYLNEDKTAAYNPPIYFEGDCGSLYCQFSLQHTDSYTESIFSYVNNIPTSEGGTHETGFKSGLTKVLNDFMRANNYLKEKEANLMGEDFREGLTGILSIKMKNVQFEGQTKTKLGNVEAKNAVENFVISSLENYSKEKSSFNVMDNIAKKAIAAAKVRTAARQAKDIARAKNSIENAHLVGKLSSCTSRKSELNELFIVEGDSAGGSAKQGRDRYYQAILPLRGKPLNAEKKRLDQVLANEEIRTIISALGCGIGGDFDISSLNYHKIIILSDADQDGAHIRAILLTFFFRYMKDLINEGFVYIGMPPLYKVYKKDVVMYAYDDNELQDKIAQVGKGYAIQRYKGLGEMNPEQLWETTMNPATRMLTKVTIEDGAEAEKLITTLMGDNIESRKKYITEYANFSKEDNFGSFAKKMDK